MLSEPDVERLQRELQSVFEHLHRSPESSCNEHQTTAYLAGQLAARGLRVRTFSDLTGVIGEWGPSSGPVIAVRSDIDALWQEVDGVWCANHSCGHDAHMSMVLTTVDLLHQLMPDPKVRLRVLFQPAEEKGTGAIEFVKRGAMDDVVYLFGVHVRPIQELEVGQMAAAIRHGSSCEIQGVIHGISAHAARPQLGVNAIEVAATLVQAIGGIHIDPTIPATAKMTCLHAGGDSGNVIPSTASFTLDLRAQTNATMDVLTDMVEERIEQVAALFHAEVTHQRTSRTMAAEVHPESRDLVAESITELLGATALAPDIITPGAEDFHFYTHLRPAIRATMLGLGCGASPGLHHPHMRFDQTKLWDGARILANAVIHASVRMADM